MNGKKHQQVALTMRQKHNILAEFNQMCTKRTLIPKFVHILVSTCCCIQCVRTYIVKLLLWCKANLRQIWYNFGMQHVWDLQSHARFNQQQTHAYEDDGNHHHVCTYLYQLWFVQIICVLILMFCPSRAYVRVCAWLGRYNVLSSVVADLDYITSVLGD